MTGLAVLLATLAVALWPGRSHRVEAARERESRGIGTPRGMPVGSTRRRSGSLWWQGRGLSRRRGGGVPGSWVAELAELTGVGLEAGLPPVAAARLALTAGVVDGGRGDGPVAGLVRDAIERAAARGASVGLAVAEVARRADPPSPQLTFLSAVWCLSDELGAPGASATRTAAAVLRERAAADGRRRAIAAGPRASMWLLSLLPAASPAVAWLLGLPVLELYGSPAGALAVGLGAGLTAVGWMWSRALIARATRPRGLSR